MSTFIDGVGASENIDSSGEKLSIAGMDTSSLEKDGVFNWEHKNDQPGQIVGKILKAKKIFTDADCEDDRQLYFWNKIKVPYLYVMGELMDDYKESAKEVAGMFRYDTDKKGQNERSVMNFSVEGAKIHKEGIEVTRSIARKITITAMPCNKAAVAEMIVAPQKSKNNVDELFKTENIEIEILQINDKSKLWDLLKKEKRPTLHKDGLAGGGASSALSGVGPSSAGGLALSETNRSKPHPILSRVDVPNRMGTHIGENPAGIKEFTHGKPGNYDGAKVSHEKSSQLHTLIANDTHTDPATKQHHAKKPERHNKRAHNLEHTIQDVKYWRDAKKPSELEKASTPGSNQQQIPAAKLPMTTSQKHMQKALTLVPKPDAKGKHLGNTSSGKPVHANGKISDATNSGFTAADHRDAADLHIKAGNSAKGGLHMQAAQSADRRQERLSVGMKQKAAQTAARDVPTKKMTADKLFHPDRSGKVKPPGPIQKAMAAGSGLSAPDRKTGGEALAPEHLRKDAANPALAPKDRKVKDLQSKIDAGTYKPDASKIADKMVNHPSKPLGKSESLAKAEEAYQKWEKREQFEQFMAKRMPGLTKGEIKAIGQAMMFKSLKKVKKGICLS